MAAPALFELVRRSGRALRGRVQKPRGQGPQQRSQVVMLVPCRLLSRATKIQQHRQRERTWARFESELQPSSPGPFVPKPVSTMRMSLGFAQANGLMYLGPGEVIGLGSIGFPRRHQSCLCNWVGIAAAGGCPLGRAAAGPDSIGSGTPVPFTRAAMRGLSQQVTLHLGGPSGRLPCQAAVSKGHC